MGLRPPPIEYRIRPRFTTRTVAKIVDCDLYRFRPIRKTWGDEVAGGFSFGLIFTLLALPAVALPFLGRSLGSTGMMAGAGLALLYWLALSVVSSAVQGIFVAALYRYAKTKQVSPGFRLQNFSTAWQPKH
jgi:hypothetical protein